jgi:hypothetical protein
LALLRSLPAPLPLPHLKFDSLVSTFVLFFEARTLIRDLGYTDYSSFNASLAMACPATKVHEELHRSSWLSRQEYRPVGKVTDEDSSLFSEADECHYRVHPMKRRFLQNLLLIFPWISTLILGCLLLYQRANTTGLYYQHSSGSFEKGWSTDFGMLVSSLGQRRSPRTGAANEVR